MIMEYAEGGELFNYIIEKGILTEDESRNIYQQIIDAIYYIHQMGVCHRDLKPENILFDSKERKRIKIIDFGLSNLYIAGNLSNSNSSNITKKKDLLETPCGSPGYAPPEMILGCKYDGIMTDIWSSGIILYAMLCGCLPFDDFSEDKLYSKIIKGNYEYPTMIKISEEAKNFINSILVVNPKQRAKIDEIKNSKWFLKNYKPSMGLYISICEIPVSNLILKEMEKRGYDKKKIVDCIKNNNHNSLTTIYYLLVKQKLKQGIGTESDMISNIFHEYIKEQNLKNQKDNIKPISLKMFITKTKTKKILPKKHKENSENKENKENKDKNIKEEKENEIKKDKNKNNDDFDLEINNKESINKSIKSKNKDLDNKQNNINKENNIKKINKIKNKTISKEKNPNINNIHINNIKNFHYININNIKTNILMKTCDNDNNRIKLYKKITELSKNKKDSSNSNSKNKGSKKLNTININKMKEGQFRYYMNLQNVKKNTNNSRTKRIKKEKTSHLKNNKTMLGESNQLNKDSNLSLNNNENKNNSIAIEKNIIKKGIFLSKNINNINKSNRDKFIMNFRIKNNKSKNFKSEKDLKQICFNQIKNNEFFKQKKYNNNSKIKKVRENNNCTNAKNQKINNLKIESIPKMGYLLNDFKTSRIAKNRLFMNSVSNSQSKSKSKTRGTRTSNSSNSQSKSKSNSIRDKIKKDSFFAFKSSRNNYSKSKSGKKNIGNKFTNLTQEKLSNLRCIKNCNNILGKEKRNFIKNKKIDLRKNVLNKKKNVKGSANSKSKKNVLSKPKNNNNNYYNKLQNFRTSIEHHKLKKKIKSKNYMNILINDNNCNNIFQMHKTNILENKKNYDNNTFDQKQNQNLNFGVIINTNKNKDNLRSSKIKSNKDESSNQNYLVQKFKKNEDHFKDIMNNFIKQKNNFQKSNLNHIKKNVKDKIKFHSINNYNKFKEYNKNTTLNNASNTQDEQSLEFASDLSNLKLSSKNKVNKNSNNSKIIKSNNNKKNSKKKIKIGDLKPFQIKNFPIYQDIKPQTYRKDKKFFDETIFSNDSKTKEYNNIIYPLVNFSYNSINNGIFKQ